jgi:hypothetical protein
VVASPDGDALDCPNCDGPEASAAQRRFVVQRWGFGSVVAERGKRRIATFNSRRSAERYRDALNAGTVKP